MEPTVDSAGDGPGVHHALRETRRDDLWIGVVHGRWERFAGYAAVTDEYVVDLAEPLTEHPFGNIDSVPAIAFGVFGRSRDGRVLRTDRTPAPAEPEPRPASKPVVIDLSPVREMLPEGPLVWREAR